MRFMRNSVEFDVFICVNKVRYYVINIVSKRCKSEYVHIQYTSRRDVLL